MIENLEQTLPMHCQQALRLQLNLLDREIERNFIYPEDLALARIADSRDWEGVQANTSSGPTLHTRILAHEPSRSVAEADWFQFDCAGRAT
jgi:hypothetical protein